MNEPEFKVGDLVKFKELPIAIANEVFWAGLISEPIFMVLRLYQYPFQSPRDMWFASLFPVHENMRANPGTMFDSIDANRLYKPLEVKDAHHGP